MQSPIRVFSLFALWFVMSLAGCEQWAPSDFESTAQALHEEEKMTMSPVTAADYGGSLPLSSISCPDAGEKVKAEDIRAPVAALLAETDDIRSIATGLENDKVDRAGDTMTGTLTINASAPNSQALYAVGNGTFPAIYALGGTNGKAAIFDAGTNQDAVLATGNGTGFGVRGIGGASGGGGGRFEATASGTMGISAVGGPSGGTGIVATGGAGGLAAELYPGTTATATVPQMGVYTEGFLRLAGTDPNRNVDPGANNALHGANIIKSWVTFNDSYAILDGYNIASITHVAGSIYAVAFVRPMANANYGVKINVHGAPGYSGAHNGTKTVNGFQFVLFKTDTLALGFGAATEAYIEIMGRQ